jgi:LCP family protein required for cell wall assembly
MADDTSVQPSGPKGHPHLRRVFLAASASVSALVMVIGAAGMGAYFWTRSQITTFEIDTLPAAATPGVSPAANQEPDIAGKCDTQACNYLLLGSDSREGLTPAQQEAFGTEADVGGTARSDTIIVVHTDPKSQQAVFLSFPRDLWVEVAGVGPGRINSAFEGGIEGNGPVRVARTVTDLTGLKIHHVMYVSLVGFEGLVDSLGGVDMCVPSAMKDELASLDIPAGCQHFDGATALAYVRSRHQPCDAIPDFARIGRQQQFLRAVISKLLSPSEIFRVPALIPELLKNLVVDDGLKNPAELVYLAGQLNGVNTGAADFRSVPTTTDGIYVNGQYLSIVRAVEPDASELYRRIREGLPLGDLGTQLPSTPPSPANIAVDVYDKASGGKAYDVLGTLTTSGFLTEPTLLDARELDAPAKGTVIVFAAGQEEKAKVVAGYIPGVKMAPAPSSVLHGADVAVIVTSRYTPLEPGQGSEATTSGCV